MRLWVDTDVGTNPDDAVALLCARRHPAVDLVGVSTCGRDPAVGARVARRVLAWPIGSRPRDLPLGTTVAAPRSVRSTVPVIDGRELTVPDIDGARADVVLGIGPVTNLARLLATGWTPPRVVLMGGALAPVRHRGRRRTVESNVAADPVAMRAVLGGARPLVVPLDVTVRMRLDPERRGAILRSTPRLVRQFADWHAALRADGVPEDEVVVCLHDPLALLVATGDVPVVVDERRLVVDDDGRLSSTFAPDVALVDVVVDVDTEAALDRVVRLMTGSS